MASHYLLACGKCGQQRSVSPSQAGETIACACGAPLEVPPMRELRKLDRQADNMDELPPIWGLRQGLVFLGLVIMASSLAFSGYLYLQRPKLSETLDQRASPEAIEQQIDALTLNQSWSLWLHLRAQGIQTGEPPEVVAFNRGMQSLWRQIMLGLGVATAGAAIAASGLLVRSGRRP